jgi:hypothetical protein
VAKTKRKTDPTRSRPLSLEFLRDLGALKALSLPAGPFDPDGTWTASYRLWLVQRNTGGGCLQLRREPADDGVRLDVELRVAEVGGYLRRTRVELRCAADDLCTPKSWTLTSRSIGLGGRPIKGTEVAETGSLRRGVVEVRFGDRRRSEKVPGPVTSNWSLLEAVQRWKPGKIKPLAFTMLEELDLPKPGQRLGFREKKDFELNGRKLRLCGYQQIGRGVLPWQYWVDERGRLLAALSGVRALLYDPGASQWTEERLDRARARLKRMGQLR